ncbi:hypothetical protein HA402_009534 [Bradysia odoriphaga]|nr:hypothetical protein HA402_009534 [Bradysia odoriphaga]
MISVTENPLKKKPAMDDLTLYGSSSGKIDSSFFARIVKTQQKKSYTSILEELLYKRSEFGNGDPIKHQRLVERDALKRFEEFFGDYPLRDCGLFIDPESYFLCANPTKLYGNEDIVNVKCPLKQYGKTFDKAIREIPFWKKVNGSWELNKQHEWFIELQGDLHITGRNYGNLMVWLGEKLGEAQFRIVRIPRDDAFFRDKMKPKLDYFYENVMVKELVYKFVT